MLHVYPSGRGASTYNRSDGVAVFGVERPDTAHRDALRAGTMILTQVG